MLLIKLSGFGFVFVEEMGLLLSKNPHNLHVFFSFCLGRFGVSIRKDTGLSLVSRTGRCLQRYDGRGYREVVGCIPYRYRETDESSSGKELEVLLVSSQKGQAMMFPKGGWECDETMEEAAKRETLEEAGVIGTVEEKLDRWFYKSKRCDIMHWGHMFPLRVNKQCDSWPEKDLRQRKWMTVAEAREVCQGLWMKEALDMLVDRKLKARRKEEADETTCT